jgi:hypothetical protein
LDEASLRAYGIALDSTEQSRPGRHNRFHQDRRAVRAGRSFSGITGLIEEDVAVSVSGGPIRDRSVEALSVADLAIGRLYRVYLDSVRRVAAGQAPVGLSPAAKLDRARGASGQIGPGGDWRSLVPEHQRPVA